MAHVFDAVVKLIEVENQCLLSGYSQLNTFSEDEKKSYDEYFKKQVTDIKTRLEEYKNNYASSFMVPGSDFAQKFYCFVLNEIQCAIVDIVQMRADKLYIRNSNILHKM